MTLAEVQVKWSVILIDRLGPDIFSTLRMKGHVLHRARAHLKVPGSSLVWNTLLNKKLPMFLSRSFFKWREEMDRQKEKQDLDTRLSYCNKTIKKWAFPVHDFCFSLISSDRGSWTDIQIWDRQKRDLNIRLNLLHPWNDSCFSKLFCN